MTASAPVIENSNMLPHGGRPAETPRATIDRQVQRERQHGERHGDPAEPAGPRRPRRVAASTAVAGVPAGSPRRTPVPTRPSRARAPAAPPPSRRRGEPNASSAA